MSNTPVQSSNVTKLCSELGFSGVFPGREEKVLTAQTHKCPVESLSQGTPFPFFRSDSPEAQQLALQFCNENRRGHFLWPDNTHNGWPTWSTERTKILRLLAHIISLQAFYKYQKLCKDRKRQRKEDLIPMESSQSSVRGRELSPESRMLVGPMPPKGTRRRPAKKANSATNLPASNGGPSTASNHLPDPYPLETYIDHIESLDPKEDERPLREFTKKWLSRSVSQWPTSADPRLYNFMHEHKAYDPEHEDIKELALVNHMRTGTEIEQVQALQYNTLKERILDRVRFLSSDMQDKKILVYTNGKLQMATAFREVWNERSGYWAQKARNNSANDAPPSTYGTLDLYDDDEDDCVPSILKKKSSKGKQPLVEKKNTPVKTPQRRKADDSPTQARTSSTYFSPHTNKRQRIEPDKTLSPEDNVRLSTENRSDQMMGLEQNTASDAIDADTAEYIRFAEHVLKSPSMTERPVTPQPTIPTIVPPGPKQHQSLKTAVLAASHKTTATKHPPPAPTSPVAQGRKAETIVTKDKPSAATISRSQPVRVPTVSPHHSSPATTSFKSTSSKSSTIASTLPSRSPLPSPAATSRRRNLEILLTLQNSDRTWDLENKYPAPTYLRHLDAAAFFAFFSQRSGVALADLDYLTFKLNFAKHPRQIEVINQNSGDAEWEKLKTKIKKFYRFVRSDSPDETDFDIWIEFGNKKATQEQREDSVGF